MPQFDNRNEDVEGNTIDDASDGWVPEEALANMVEDRSINPLQSEEGATKSVFKKNAHIVAQSIVNMAIYSKSERTRLDAGKYVIDRVLGRVGDPILVDDDSPISRFINDVTGFVAEAAAEHENQTESGNGVQDAISNVIQDWDGM